MRRTKTAQMQSKVYLCESEREAERLFRKQLNQTKVGGDKVFRWSGQMGSIDVDSDRTYYMTGEHFNKWKETHSNYEVIRVSLGKGGEEDVRD